MLTEGPQFQGASHGSWLWAHPLTAASTTANIGLFLRLKSQIADEVFKAPGFKDKTRRRAFQQIKYCFHNSKRSMAPAHPWHKPGKVQTFQTWRTEFHWDSDEIDDLIILSVNLKGRQLKQKFSPFETNSILARHKSDPLISLYPVLPGPEWLQVEAYYSDSFRPQLSFSNSIRHSDIEPGEEFFSFNICVTGHSDSFNICVTLFGRTISSPAHWIILELFFFFGILQSNSRTQTLLVWKATSKRPAQKSSKVGHPHFWDIQNSSKDTQVIRLADQGLQPRKQKMTHPKSQVSQDIHGWEYTQ